VSKLVALVADLPEKVADPLFPPSALAVTYLQLSGPLHRCLLLVLVLVPPGWPVGSYFVARHSIHQFVPD
jgi:hypothetical protein